VKAGIWIAAIALVGLAEPAAAGIYKCQGPDGKTTFTSDPTACPGAQPHELKKKVQNVLDERSSPVLRGGGSGSRPASRGPGARGDGLETMWRRKRPTAEQELKDVEQRVARMKNVLKGCNRGGEWYTTDESGMRQHIPCSELREKYVELQAKQQELVVYLADGLEDECRRAGCQPGWVR